ncbi:MAG TPA: replication initiator, partial [Solirubrobacter sp.]
MTAAPELLVALAERARSVDLAQLDARLRASGGCARPIRLRGRIEVCDGHGNRRVWSTDTEPDGVLRKACGNRREAVCAPCAERYRQDAYHLIAAGLRGGKGVPETIAGHPAVFVTLTAPSFGVVHTPGPRRCRPRRDDPVCPHGVRLSCGAVHADDDPRLGEPLCRECFDYRAAVTWNHALGELWRYTTIYVARAMAQLAGMTQAALKREVRPAYVKVAEYQRRGLVHLHVLVRLDRAMPDYRADELHPP